MERLLTKDYKHLPVEYARQLAHGDMPKGYFIETTEHPCRWTYRLCVEEHLRFPQGRTVAHSNSLFDLVTAAIRHHENRIAILDHAASIGLCSLI